jgi:hypothetical protein
MKGPSLVTINVLSCRDCIYNKLNVFNRPSCEHPEVALPGWNERGIFERELDAKQLTPYWCPEDVE